MNPSLLTALAATTVALPLLASVLVATPSILGKRTSERYVTTIVATLLSAAFLTSIAVAIGYLRGDQADTSVSLLTWLGLKNHSVPLSVLVDGPSVAMMVLTTSLAGIVGRFSFRYLHKEPGFVRFFVLLCLFEGGMLGLTTAGSLDLFIAGWEIVGVTSMLLIAFFTGRPEPRESALRAFVSYRLCDIGLLFAAALLHHETHGSGLGERLRQAHIGAAPATLIAIGILWAAAGKSAQLPWSAWLPRAMEGPTPSSAIFYGALSVHAGAFLLIRTAPLFEHAGGVRVAIISIGALTAIGATLVGRAQADVKTSLAYASMTQTGLIFAEIGAGFPKLALIHIIGHAALRSWQLLRAPSFLHEQHVLDHALGGDAPERGRHVEKIFPRSVRTWLYRLALDRLHLETVAERWIIAPAIAAARTLDAIERKIDGALSLVGRQGSGEESRPSEENVPNSLGEQQ